MADGRQSFFSGAAALTGAVFVTKVLGALYKIPLANLLGSRGMAHFYVAYHIFNVVAAATTVGFPAAVSKLVSQNRALGRKEQTQRIFSAALWLLGIIGAIAATVMGGCSHRLAMWLHDPAASTSIQALAPAALFMCLCAAVRGYTQGMGDMRPTARSQIAESLGKLIFGMGFCLLLLRRGASPETASASALFGVSVGGVFGFLVLLPFCRKSGKGTAADALTILWVAIPIAAGGVGISLLDLADQSLILRTLQISLGYTKTRSAELYGEYSFVMPLFALVPALAGPLAAALMPNIAGALAKRQKNTASAHTRSALELAALISIPMGLGLSVLAEPLLRLIYPAQIETAAAAAPHLAVLGIAAVFVSFSAVTGGILQAWGRSRIPLLALLCGGVVKLAADVLLVQHVGIHGAAVSALLCYSIIAAIQLLAVERVSGIRFKRIVAVPLLCAVVMAIGTQLFQQLLCRYMPSNAACLLAVAAGMGIYVILLPATGVLSLKRVQRWYSGV